jgi:hypothetical protein
MPHLHLPSDHTEADLVLAANLAEIVGSEDLYVVWSHETGPGAVPEVEAVVYEERPPSALSEFVSSIGAAFGAFWRALVGKPVDGEVADDAESPRPYADPGRTSAG